MVFSTMPLSQPMDQNPPSQEARLHFLDYWRVIKTRKVIIFLVFLLVVLTVFTVTLFQPKIYVASARIKVEPERPTVAVFEQSQAPSYDPYFLQTQYEIIQSQKILYPVIDRLGLRRVWGEKESELPIDIAFRRLKGQISVRRFRDTSLIEIAVYETDPRLAAELANTIAEVFERDRLDVKRLQTQKGIDKVREEMGQQQERLRLAQEKVERLRKELDVPILGSANNAFKLTDQMLQQLQTQLTEARVELSSREARLSELRQLNIKQLRNAITILSDDPNVKGLLQSLTDAETRLEVMKEDYGPEHPNVRAAISARDKLLEQLDARVDGILRGFEVEYEMAKARVNEIQKQLDDAKNVSISLESEKFLPFRNAQREEELETKLYEALKIRLQQVSVELEVPKSPVEVLDRAEPPLPQFYVRPNIWLNVTMGAAAGLILGIGLAFFIEFLDTSVKKIEDVEKYFGLPVLGVIGQQAGLLSSGEASPGDLEAYRMLRTNIEFSQPDGKIKSLCVLSPGAGEGKSLTIANLAYLYAQHGLRVLVVDCDFRRPGIHEFMGVANQFGLADYLTATKQLREVMQTTGVPNVSIIASGSGALAKAALPMLTSPRMADLIKEVASQFDMVLYDTPPVLGVSDAAIMAREVQNSILVIQHRRYPRAMVRRAVQIVNNSGGRLLGVVVNKVHAGHDETNYYYHTPEQPARATAKAKASKPAVAAAAGKPADDDAIGLSGKY